jgi:hypothetical protein
MQQQLHNRRRCQRSSLGLARRYAVQHIAQAQHHVLPAIFTLQLQDCMHTGFHLKDANVSECDFWKARYHTGNFLKKYV